jgi:Xaa-Pro aminopeptidase
MMIQLHLAAIQRALANAELDGWLLFDFRGINPIAHSLLGLEGMVTRRYFCYIPREGTPVALTHAIEQGPWQQWPPAWQKRVYSDWRVLEQELATLVKGKRVAMEYYPGDAVPYLDRIPAGVLELVTAAGATVESSADLVTQFYAVWTPEQLASHTRAAEHIAQIAHEAFQIAAQRARSGAPTNEFELTEFIRSEFSRRGLVTDHGPNVSVGANAANPHYEPSATENSVINDGDIVLIDLWAHEPAGVFADQTWMASLGAPSERSAVIWDTVRGARDAAIELLRARVASGTPVRGYEVDDAARNYIAARGFQAQFLHRTGHSIDAHELHGSGPNMDNLETREERLLLPGVAFSIEPGIYFAGEIGMRSEVNGFIGDDELIITPNHIQHDLIVV